ncbi:hypothetical protein BDR22DRAFT_892409 [Usnea florida]
MPEESSVDYSSEKTFCGSVADSACRHELLEEVSFMTEASGNPHRQRFWRRYLLPCCAHLFTFLIYSTLVTLALNARSKSVQSKRNILYSPANNALRWKLHEFHSGDGHEGPFSGYPRPELEEAWEGLLGKMNVRFSLEDLKVFDREEDAVQLPDGSGYAGTLNIYHEIHCVKWMHTHMYQEHYYPNLDDAQREENRLHSGRTPINIAKHCLTHLRKSAMCHGDVGMVTYRWGNVSRKPEAAATAHECIDWDSMAEWTNERTIDMFKPGYLIHPVLGPAYGEGEDKDLME